MTHVVTEQCVHCKYTECVTYCPAACFREADTFLVIDPEECIDCAACVTACPADAIYHEDDLTPDLMPALEWNARMARVLPPATTDADPAPESDRWNGVPGKWATLPPEQRGGVGA